MPVPEQLHVFDVYRMRVRFGDDPTKSRNHYVAAIVIQADDDGGVAVELTSNPIWHGARAMCNCPSMSMPGLPI